MAAALTPFAAVPRLLEAVAEKGQNAREQPALRSRPRLTHAGAGGAQPPIYIFVLAAHN
jgi:hypothetical protein